MSHWPVDDQTTAELMRFFYDRLSQGLTKSEALRQAKLDFISTTHSARVHPFFWGSFVIPGDDTPHSATTVASVSSYLDCIDWSTHHNPHWLYNEEV